MKKIFLLSICIPLLSNNVYASFWDMFSSNRQTAEPSVFEKMGKSIDENIASMGKSLNENITNMEKHFSDWKQELSDKFSSSKENSGYDETKSIYFVEIVISGYETKDISVQASQDQHLLIIKALKEKKDNTSEEKASFQFTKTLPENIDLLKASWTYKDGKLRVEFPANIQKINMVTIKQAKE